MEVVHSDDHVTHAIVGGSEKIDYTIEDGAFFMQMLSASLYKDQMLAVVREVICNADDAHKMGAGQPRPFEVQITDEKFIVRDFGPGIPHDQIGPIYATYGRSTKQGDDGQTGGFGLGCKAPFAYTDNFQVTSWHNGTKTIYRMSKSDSEVGGKPSIVKILSVPTQESGLEVSINLAKRIDKTMFSSRIDQVISNGDMNALVNGKKAATLPFHLMTKGYMITNEQPLFNQHKLLVRYGAVIYPIEENDSYKNEYYDAFEILRGINCRDSNHNFCAVLQAKPNSLSLTPSREGLTITEKATDTIKDLLTTFVKNYNNEIEVDTIKLHFDGVKAAAEAKDAVTLMDKPSSGKLNVNYIPTAKNSDGAYFITDTNSLARWSLHLHYPGEHDNTFLRKDILHRAGLMIQQDICVDRGLMRRFRTALNKRANNRYGVNWHVIEQFRRDVVYPVVAGMRNNKFLDKYALKVLVPWSRWGAERSYYRSDSTMTRSALNYSTEAFDNYFIMQKRVIVLTHDAEEAGDRYRSHRSTAFPEMNKKYGRITAGFLVYEIGRAKAKLEAAREYFSKLKGYDFIDLTKEVEYREPKPRAPKINGEKLKGYATLSGIKQGSLYDWQLITNSPMRTEKPEAYAIPYGKSDYKGRDCVVGFETNETAMLNQLYGHEIAAIMHPAAIETARKNGMKMADEWLPGRIVRDLQDKDLLAALPGSYHVFGKWLEEQDVDHDFVDFLVGHAELREILKIPMVCDLNEKQSCVIHALGMFRYKFTDLANADAVKKIDAMVPSKPLMKFVEKLQGNELLGCIDTEHIANVFSEYSTSSPETKAKVLKILKTVIKG